MDQTTELHPSEKEEEKKWSSRDKYSSDEEQHTNISPRSPNDRPRDSHRHENERRMPSPKNGEEYHECCRECNRDHRRNGRACICQVPSSQRRAPLGNQITQNLSPFETAVLLFLLEISVYSCR